MSKTTTKILIEIEIGKYVVVIFLVEEPCVHKSSVRFISYITFHIHVVSMYTAMCCFL